MPSFFDFRGMKFRTDKINAVGEVITISTGSQSCDWCLGFEVVLDGGTIAHKVVKPNQFGYAGGPTQDQYRDAAEGIRQSFIKTWMENVTD